MILENSRNIKKEFDIVFELEQDKKKYIIYKDPNNGNLFGGIIKNDTVKALSDKEYDMLNTLVERVYK